MYNRSMPHTLVDELDELTENAADAIRLLIDAAQNHTTTGTKDMTAAIKAGIKAANAIYDEYNKRDEAVAS